MMRSKRLHTRWHATWVLVLTLALLVALMPGAPDSLAAGGDFWIDFVAAAPESYDHATGGGAYDDGTNGVGADVVESLEAGYFACGDIVTFFAVVHVDDTAQAATDAPQTIEMDFSFLMDTTGQSGVAIGDVVNVQVNYSPIQDLIAGEDNVEDGIIDDGGSTATILSETTTGPMYTAGSELLLTVQLDDLERAEVVVVRIDTRIYCDPGSGPTGNLAAALTGSYLTYINGTTPVEPPEAIPGGGEQTIPFKQVGNLTYEADLGINKACPTFTLDDFDFEIVVTNYGLASAGALTLTDTLVDGLTVSGITSAVDDGSSSEATCTVTGQDVSCTLGELRYPGSWTVNIQVAVDPEVWPSGSNIPNTAAVSALSPEPAPEAYVNTSVANCTTPVTLASFRAVRRGDGVRFEWSTVTELGNVGFNLYAQTEDGRQRVNDELIPSHVVDSVLPQDYSYEAKAVVGDLFFIEDVDVLGRTQLHGPFRLGKPYGTRTAVEPIDWATIRAEHEAKGQGGMAKGVADTLQEQPALRETTVMPVAGPIELLVEHDGLCRVTYEELQAAGFDLAGEKVTDLALTNRGAPVPIYVQSSGSKFGPGAYLEFYGQALDTLYTDTNVYELVLARKLAQRVAVDDTAPDLGAQPATYYMETVTVDRNRAYSHTATNGDPWYDTMLLAYGPKSWSFPLEVEGYLPGVAPSRLWVDLWGSSDLVEGPDHHVVVDLNGVYVTDALFDGRDPYVISAELTGDPQEGPNTLGLTLPVDAGAAFDLSVLNSYRLTYPRAFLARDGRLAFEAMGGLFRVQDLPSSEVVVYRLDGGGLARLAQTQVAGSDGSFDVTFAGSGSPATYLVSSAEALWAPAIEEGRSEVNITSGLADYLMIAHGDFVAGLAPLVEAREAEGYTVRVVDVGDVYDQFSGGVFDPQAIRDYITYAATNMGTEYVLLVGGDTKDYHDYLGLGSISFIPTLYAAISDLEKFVPVDPLYADVDGDNLPDLAIGRLPVRTSAELGLVIDKTLAYSGKDYDQTAVFVADDGYAADSESLFAQLPAEWSVQRAYIDELGADQARATLLAAVNGGVSLTNYVGHSGLTKWAREDLLNVNTATTLTNHGNPTVVLQWGCWNAYYVEPSYNTMAHAFLLSGDQGAAAVLGPPTLSGASSQRALGEIMMAKLASPGTTLGMALQQAKAELAAGPQGLSDDLLGWTILGDPTLVVQP